jgi:hypothetical protein
VKVRLLDLVISCQRYVEVITFGRFIYIYGKMGAGKSSIARLADFCLGGRMDLTPALQSEFVAATLRVVIEGQELSLERARGSDRVRARWQSEETWFDVVLPARRPGEEVMPASGVYVLSDLVFYLAGIQPPRVRRSKLDEDSSLERLSLRDLLWYCYLDQDTIDSEFFHLEVGAEFAKRNKSRDVLRLIVGFHQERVAELEAELERVRQHRQTLVASADALQEALASTGVASAEDIETRLSEIGVRVAEVNSDIERHRSAAAELSTHAMDTLRSSARSLDARIQDIDSAASETAQQTQDEKRHLNELLSLSTRFRRLSAARTVLNGVAFETCPSCLRPIPARAAHVCGLCGQEHVIEDVEDVGATEADLDARTTELSDAIGRRGSELARLRRQLSDLRGQKAAVDEELCRAAHNYDSAYLSSALASEQEAARLGAEARQLRRLSVLPAKVLEQRTRATNLAGDEAMIRAHLRDLRAAAEGDSQNLEKLAELFLDCLLRARIPGFDPSDVVKIGPPWFLPNVTSASAEALTSTSFSNLGSGGKKTLFKCCFALAVHRLAVRQNALLPTLLIIDSPMKNISERENKEQFEGFYELLYELAAGELSESQFVVIDKEHFAPKEKLPYEIAVRHMSPDDDPLLKGYKGH